MEQRAKTAWLPVTPRGVAAFARARIGRLWLVQSIVALVAAALIGWFVNAAWFSVIRAAIHKFPTDGQIEFQHLHWPDESQQLLAEGHFLAISVDEDNTGSIRSPAHVQVEFGNNRVRFYSLLGYRDQEYPHGWIPFNRTKLEPVWDAWRPMLVAGVVLGVLCGLFFSWAFLASIYFIPVWIMGFFFNRDLDLRASWKLAGAALMPGALFLMLTIFVYALGLLDLVQLMAGFVIHFVIGWVFLFIAPFCLPKESASAAAGKNPFASGKKS